METMGKRVAVYYAMPLCKKCDSEVSRVQRASEQSGAGMQVTFSLWKRFKYGLSFLTMPVVVVDNRPFSVLGAFNETALVAELKEDTKQPPHPVR